MEPIIRFKKLHPDAILPAYQTAGAAGMDLHSVKDVLIDLTPEIYDTGLAVEIPDGYEGQIRGRSGLAAYGLHCYLGTLDSDYRGRIWVRLQLINPPEGVPLVIYQGQRFAQLVISPVARCVIQVAEELTPTERGSGGFGHTGR